jgi:hypothetical protein
MPTVCLHNEQHSADLNPSANTMSIVSDVQTLQEIICLKESLQERNNEYLIAKRNSGRMIRDLFTFSQH